MRELTFQATIPGCSIQDFYTIACSDSQAITRFHRDVNKDDSVAVSEWSAGRRQVEFTLAMAMPASVQRFVGAGPIRIKESQVLTWQGDSALKIVSEPELQISYAKALRTAAELLISNTAQGVSIDVCVQVNAAVPWPMQGTVESIMADQARKTVGQYVEYIGGYVEAALEEMNNQRKLAQQAATTGVAVAVAGGAAEAAAQHEALVAGPPTPVEAPAAPAPAPARAVAQQAAAAVVPAARPPAQLAVPAAAALEPADVFYDASEAVPGSALDLLLRELREERAARLEANRLLASIKDSVQHLDQAVSLELAFQEGVRYATRMGGGTLFLSVVTAAAAASATTAYLLMRRNALK